MIELKIIDCILNIVYDLYMDELFPRPQHKVTNFII
jgi:hypothetical protein